MSYECPMCNKVMRDASTTSCGCTFCEECATEYLKNNKTCFSCQQPVNSVQPSYNLRKMINLKHGVSQNNVFSFLKFIWVKFVNGPFPSKTTRQILLLHLLWGQWSK